MSEKVIQRLAALAEEFRAENGGSLAGIEVELAFVLFDFCQALELTYEQASQVLAGDYERVLAEIGEPIPA